MDSKIEDAILDFEPQLVEVEYGKEPSIIDLLYLYYTSHGLTDMEATLYTAKYCEQMLKNIDNQYKGE